MKIDSGGVALDVEVEGAGRPVVLIHGWPDTKRLWSKQVPALVDAGFQVISYDQRGYGASDKPAEIDAYSIPFLAIDVTVILDHLGVERAHVVGHDWGSATAWATAAFAPERVDHLVSLSVGHPSAFADMSMEQRAKSWYMLLFQFAPQAEQWLTMNDAANFRAFAPHPDFDATFAEYIGNGRSLRVSTTTARTSRPMRSSRRRPSCRRSRRRRWVCGARKTSHCWKAR